MTANVSGTDATEFLKFNINHVFLPPKLLLVNKPGPRYEFELARSVRESLSRFVALEPESAGAMGPAMSMLESDSSTIADLDGLKKDLFVRISGHPQPGGIC